MSSRFDVIFWCHRQCEWALPAEVTPKKELKDAKAETLILIHDGYISFAY